MTQIKQIYMDKLERRWQGYAFPWPTWRSAPYSWVGELPVPKLCYLCFSLCYQ